VKILQWTKSGITRVYKYNEKMLLTEIRYDDGSVQNIPMMRISTETVRRTEMATRRTHGYLAIVKYCCHSRQQQLRSSKICSGGKGHSP